MHSKSDSEVTSLPGSSPPRSPRLLLRPPASTAPPAYYVQSPSRDSHDGGDSKLSFQSTPLLSPLGSPLHPGGGFARDRSSDARSSASSQATTVPRKHTHHHSRRVQPQPAHNSASNKSNSNEASHHEKKLPSTIFEEDEEFGASKSITASQIYTVLFVILSCAVFLGLFILFFWLICKPGRPALSVKNIVFHNLYMSQGTDASGVPSMLLSVNATVQIDFENPSKYFGAHLNPLLVELDYSELVIATKQMDGLVQGKSSRKVISVPVGAVKVPLYGASSVSGTKMPSIPLTMETSICSHYYILGQMVKSNFCSYISCNLDINSNTMALLTPLKSACTYNPPL